MKSSLISPSIKVLNAADADFDESLEALLSFPADDQIEVRATVTDILLDVKSRGDLALVELTNKFDSRNVSDISELVVEKPSLQQAYESIDPLVADALNESVSRVRHYHEQQLVALGQGQDWEYEDELGNRLGQRVQGMRRVGIYAPGGKAAYPSTVIMTAVPARVAGVEELVLCVPMPGIEPGRGPGRGTGRGAGREPGGEMNKVLLAAAFLCDVDLVVGIGGAQAIAAMAYGTGTIPRVDKIVGPGNIYVATAKELVFGDVGIDMIAGPSEVVIVADESADPAWIVQDMFAQAEHDEMAQAIVITDDDDLIGKIKEVLPRRLEVEPRMEIIAQSIAERGALIKVADLTEAFSVVNRIAPEHLQLALEEPRQYLDQIRSAGAVFLGVNTAEVVGDYTAGPSHVLPTGGTARFASPLGVYDFQVRSSVIECTPEGTIQLNRAAAILAEEEGLSAHAESARMRVKG